ncbi:unnamed protein product [Amoebophrya sp. A25]|nr:unnamed protein product [Amoebophrya sp. A25]|eukprot:GSA25T00012067001.1
MTSNSLHKNIMQLFAVSPKEDCPHVAACVKPLSFYADKGIHLRTASCPQCGETSENWLCLRCAGVYCSRYKNEHALFHYIETMSEQENQGAKPHSVSLSFSDLSFWCYMCDSYVVAPELVPLRRFFEQQKFGQVELSAAEAIDLVTQSFIEAGAPSSSSSGGHHQHIHAASPSGASSSGAGQMLGLATFNVAQNGAGASSSSASSEAHCRRPEDQDHKGGLLEQQVPSFPSNSRGCHNYGHQGASSSSSSSGQQNKAPSNDVVQEIGQSTTDTKDAI